MEILIYKNSKHKSLNHIFRPPLMFFFIAPNTKLMRKLMDTYYFRNWFFCYSVNWVLIHTFRLVSLISNAIEIHPYSSISHNHNQCSHVHDLFIAIKYKLFIVKFRKRYTQLRKSLSKRMFILLMYCSVN